MTPKVSTAGGKAIYGGAGAACLVCGGSKSIPKPGAVPGTQQRCPRCGGSGKEPARSIEPGGIIQK